MSAFGLGIDLVPKRTPVVASVFDFTGGVLPVGASLTRASAGTRTSAAGLVVSEAANVARFDHDPATLALAGLLVEPARINALTYAEQFDQAAWTKVSVTATANDRVAPDGSTTAERLVLGGNGYLQRAVSGTVMTASVWLYASAAGSGIQLGFYDDVATGQYAAVPLAAGVWTRVVVTRTLHPSSTDRRMQLLASASGATIWAWGAQVEANGSATSYIPTAAATASRSADVLTLALGVADGTATLRVTFDDLSTQDVSATVSGGSASVSGAVLNRARVRRIERL